MTDRPWTLAAGGSARMWASPAAAQAGDRLPVGPGRVSSPALSRPNGCGDGRAPHCPRKGGRLGIRFGTPNGAQRCGIAGCADHDAVELAASPGRSDCDSQIPFVDWLKAYKYEEETLHGTLHIQPLTRAIIPRVARLLEETFADSLGYRQMFRWWLRMQAENYLAICLDCLPAGVVLVATLIPNDDFREQHANDLGKGTVPATKMDSSKFQGFDSSQFKPDVNTSGGQQQGWSSPFVPFNMQPKGFWKANGKKKDKIFQGFRDDLDVLGEKDMLDSVQLRGAAYAQNGVEEWNEGVVSRAQKKSGTDALEDSLADIKSTDESFELVSEPSQLQTSASTDSIKAEAEAEAEEQGEAKREDSAVVVDGEPAKQPVSDQEEILLGTVEVSLDNSTRPFFWFLKPPEGSAFISNMAVDPSFRRQGHGTRLLKAVEHVARRCGNPCTCLHVRFEDTGAIALYQREGYYKEDEDNFLWSAAGFDRKALLRKDMAGSQAEGGM
ncbi:unnamed protein product [Ostreobium quekettii]|uniref:N-acetyltransferase domain-containing protein n=1 Tax=Ostreobium quekettii TaxID=121088 RepID=A0A8S1IZC1_9CHLO|nr:unnamed protein product [Ostreobium quekettii]